MVFLFWARPGPEGRAGPGSAWPSNQNGQGELFPPPPLHAERYSFCMQRRKKNKHKGEEELPGVGEAVPCCVSGGAVAEDDREGGRPFFLSSLLFSSSALFSPVSFASSVNHVLPSLQRLRGGAGGGGEETDDAFRWL